MSPETTDEEKTGKEAWRQSRGPAAQGVHERQDLSSAVCCPPDHIAWPGFAKRRVSRLHPWSESPPGSYAAPAGLLTSAGVHSSTTQPRHSGNTPTVLRVSSCQAYGGCPRSVFSSASGAELPRCATPQWTLRVQPSGCSTVSFRIA